jgi:O-antigen/teichoic acid export membrane protein
MQLVTGGVVLAIGILLAPLLAHGDPGLTDAYRIVFAGSVFTFIGTSYSFALQATDPSQWNLVRVCQPVLALAGVIALARLHHLTLDTAVATVIATTAIQLGYAYCACRRRELAPGRARKDLVRPLAAYGLPQVASIAPATLNLYLALLVLSQVVSPAALGNYAVASSFTMVPVPLVTAIGYVAFPRLAARRALSASDHRMKRVAVTASIGLASAIMLPVAAVSYWLIPAVFGPAYHGAAPLLWILTPGAIFLSSGSVVGDLLRGTGRPGLVALAQGLAAVATVILLVVLLPSTGVAAAAIAQSVAYGVALAVMIRLLGRPPAQARARHRRAAAHQKEDSCG